MLKNKVVFITGASQGIGKAIALKLASLNASIALNDISAQEENLKKTKEEIEKSGGIAEYFFADVSKFDETEKMAKDIEAKFGRIDILVNNAGITKDRTFAKMTLDEWQRVIDINLNG
ncbi:MAG: SDR family NAD(P)-dependent oxidoreductase, partial [Candidatus Pacebacteria bacterium]|nr:SDR family NAD(P)-dependent oxidoreductase [Candidatus Paceibacterota bacterium]